MLHQQSLTLLYPHVPYGDTGDGIYHFNFWGDAAKYTHLTCHVACPTFCFNWEWGLLLNLLLWLIIMDYDAPTPVRTVRTRGHDNSQKRGTRIWLGTCQVYIYLNNVWKLFFNFLQETEREIGETERERAERGERELTAAAAQLRQRGL